MFIEFVAWFSYTKHLKLFSQRNDTILPQNYFWKFEHHLFKPSRVIEKITTSINYKLSPFIFNHLNGLKSPSLYLYIAQSPNFLNDTILVTKDHEPTIGFRRKQQRNFNINLVMTLKLQQKQLTNSFRNHNFHAIQHRNGLRRRMIGNWYSSSSIVSFGILRWRWKTVANIPMVFNQSMFYIEMIVSVIISEILVILVNCF